MSNICIECGDMIGEFGTKCIYCEEAEKERPPNCVTSIVEQIGDKIDQIVHKTQASLKQLEKTLEKISAKEIEIKRLLAE